MRKKSGFGASTDDHQVTRDHSPSLSLFFNDETKSAVNLHWRFKALFPIQKRRNLLCANENVQVKWFLLVWFVFRQSEE